MSEVAKQLGQKKLAKATIARIAGKIAPSESVEAAFETLRKIYRGDKKLPSQKAVIASRKILETWKRELLISKKG
ncbi:unnamed protein product, partial [marine sediment metagenome]